MDMNGGRIQMAEDLTKRGPMDRSRVITNEAWKLRYWCGRFVCTEEELKEAVDRVGVGVAKVEEYLNKRLRDSTRCTNSL